MENGITLEYLTNEYFQFVFIMHLNKRFSDRKRRIVYIHASNTANVFSSFSLYLLEMAFKPIGMKMCDLKCIRFILVQCAPPSFPHRFHLRCCNPFGIGILMIAKAQSLYTSMMSATTTAMTAGNSNRT